MPFNGTRTSIELWMHAGATEFYPSIFVVMLSAIKTLCQDKRTRVSCDNMFRMQASPGYQPLPQFHIRLLCVRAEKNSAKTNSRLLAS